MRWATVIAMLLTLFPIVGPFCLFGAAMGIGTGMALMVESGSVLRGALMLVAGAAAFFGIAQLIELTLHYLRHPARDPEPRGLRRNTAGLYAGLACMVAWPLVGPGGIIGSLLALPAAVLAVFFLVALRLRRRGRATETS